MDPYSPYSIKSNSLMKNFLAVTITLLMCFALSATPIAYAQDCPPPESCQTDCGDTLSECIQNAIDTSPSESELLVASYVCNADYQWCELNPF